MKYDSNIFIRFGGLSIKKQHGYSANSKTFHTPPAKRGVYAFPVKAIELFLLGGNYQKYSYQQLKARGAKTFKYNGQIWHHLGNRLKPNEILVRKGEWVKSEFIYWEKAFKKESLNNKYGYGGDLFGRIKSINEPIRSGVSGGFSKDNLEVFIEDKIGNEPIKSNQQKTKLKRPKYSVMSYAGRTAEEIKLFEITLKRGFFNLEKAIKYRNLLNTKYLNAEFFVVDNLTNQTIE